MKKNKAIINGREIEYGDLIHHETISHFSFWDRIKILFGKPVIVDTEILTKEECNVLGSEAVTRVPPFIKRKCKGGGMEITKLTDEELRDRINETRGRLGLNPKP